MPDDTDRWRALAVLSLALSALTIILGLNGAFGPSQAGLGVCVSYYTQQLAGGTLTTVAQVGAPIKTNGTQSCADGGFVPVTAQ